MTLKRSPEAKAKLALTGFKGFSDFRLFLQGLN
jgi:hypothetical protein